MLQALRDHHIDAETAFKPVENIIGCLWTVNNDFMGLMRWVVRLGSRKEDTMLHDGLYEQIINHKLSEELAIHEDDKVSQIEPIDEAEAPRVLADYIADVIEKKLKAVRDSGGNITDQVEVVNRIIDAASSDETDDDADGLSVVDDAKQLLALFDKQNSIWAIDDGSKKSVTRPETSIAQSSLFTGAIHEPQMYTELKKEIISCDRIDMLVSFIKWSGLRLIIDELRTFSARGGKLRVITTSYMGATDVKAVEELRQLPGTEIKVSYDTNRTRLHAKTYVFYRDTGFTTAYVGSSNLSNAAISSGLEWNIKVTRKDLPETIDKIAATFDSYWNSNEFELYTEGKKEYLARALHAEKYFDTNRPDQYVLDIEPYSYQKEILDKLEAERLVRGYCRNLIVAATGTGKTVISALDYRRFQAKKSGTALPAFICSSSRGDPPAELVYLPCCLKGCQLWRAVCRQGTGREHRRSLYFHSDF